MIFGLRSCASKPRAHLHKAAVRIFDALWRSIGGICGLFEPQERWNDLKAVGYASDAPVAYQSCRFAYVSAPNSVSRVAATRTS